MVSLYRESCRRSRLMKGVNKGETCFEKCLKLFRKLCEKAAG